MRVVSCMCVCSNNEQISSHCDGNCVSVCVCWWCAVVCPPLSSCQTDPHELSPLCVRAALHACVMHACRAVHLRTTTTSSAHEHTYSLAVCAQLQIANQHFTRQPHGPHFPDATPCADRRHGEHDHVTDLLRSGSILVLNMCTMCVRRVELWTMHHASLTSYFFFLLHASTQAGLVLPPALEHTRTCSTSLRVWQPATTILGFLSSDNIEVKSSPVDRPAIGS
jgi:hypothetical protein